MIENILVCGDGDLSFSAGISSELDMLGIKLYATVLEDEETHSKGKYTVGDPPGNSSKCYPRLFSNYFLISCSVQVFKIQREDHSILSWSRSIVWY